MTKLLIREIDIKSKLITALNQIIIEQDEQIKNYRIMITQLQDVMNDAKNIITFIDV